MSSESNKMWGGRFAMSPAEIMEEINASIGFDKVLAPQDIRGSKAHAAMLAEQGIISKTDGVSDLLELALLLKEAGLLRPGPTPQLDVNIIPLFETIEDLRLALLEFADTYNTHWLVARHGHRTPAEVRADNQPTMNLAA